MTRVEIIAVGKEILRGQTLDTNSSWLAKRITALGGVIKRLVIPDDDVAAIAQEIETSFHNGAQIIITPPGAPVKAAPQIPGASLIAAMAAKIFFSTVGSIISR